MRFLSYLTTLLIAALLSACGGGGGSTGLTSGSKLSTTAPSSVIVPAGSASQYLINGGSSPYYIKNSDTAIAVGWVSDHVLNLGAIIGGTATVSVVDSGGAQVDIAVKVGSSVALYTTTPSTFTMAPNTTQTFKVGGGSGPYTATSSNVAVASAMMNGNALTITGVAISSTPATIQIFDSTGATLTSTVTVGTVPLSLSPTSASTFVNSVVEVAVVGGTPPYRVGGLIPSAVSAVFDVNDPNKLLVTPLLVSSGLAITILDSQNSSAIFTLTVIDGQPNIRLSPNALTVSETSRLPIALTVFGATGVVNAFSSDLTLFTTAVSSDNKTITLTQQNCVLQDTVVTITAVDANRAVATSLITVKDNGNTVITTTDNTVTPPLTTSVTLPCPS